MFNSSKESEQSNPQEKISWFISICITAINSVAWTFLDHLRKRICDPIVLPSVLLINERTKVEGILPVGKVLRLDRLD